ncbi:MAG: polyhydroxyalkanoic acid system family protein [Bradymonadia bacterium]
MRHTITHSLSDDLARKTADKAFEQYRAQFAQYNPQARWLTPKKADIQFKAKGVSLKGTVELRPGAFDLELKVPLLFRPLQKKAVGIIEREIRTWIGKAERGELD